MRRARIGLLIPLLGFAVQISARIAQTQQLPLALGVVPFSEGGVTAAIVELCGPLLELLREEYCGDDLHLDMGRYLRSNAAVRRAG